MTRDELAHKRRIEKHLIEQARPKPRPMVVEDLGNGRIRFMLTGSSRLVSKKNQLKPRRNRKGGVGFVYSQTSREVKAALELQFRTAWGARKPLVHPDVEIRIFAANRRKDRDGIWTTTLDALKKAQVIWDDSIEYYNGLEVKYPAVIVPPAEERVEITLTGVLLFP